MFLASVKAFVKKSAAYSLLQSWAKNRHCKQCKNNNDYKDVQGIIIKEKMKNDEYVWKKYTQEYRSQIAEMEATAGDNGSDFLIKNISEKNGELQFSEKLHSNWKEIYAAAYALQPLSVYECGCGGMYHLKNMKTLLPAASIHGCDLLETQIKFGAEKFKIQPEIANNVSVRDFSRPDATTGLGTYDFVFCHAVLMHLAWDKAVSFLKNMGKICNRSIMFVEGTRKHDYGIMLEEAALLSDFAVSKPNKYVKESFLLTKKKASNE